MSALDEQVGGEHYKGMVIQPVEFIQKNRLGFVEGNIIKYICRWRAKNGLEDLHKVRHYIDLLIDIETGPSPVQTELDMELTFGEHQAAKLKRLNDAEELGEVESEDNRFYIDGKEVPYPDFLASYGPSPKLQDAAPADWDIAFKASTKSDRNT